MGRDRLLRSPATVLQEVRGFGEETCHVCGTTERSRKEVPLPPISEFLVFHSTSKREHFTLVLKLSLLSLLSSLQMFAFFDLLSDLVTWWLRHQRFLSSLPQFFRCTCLFAPSEIFAALTDFMRSNLFQLVPSCAEAGAVCCCQMGVWRQKGNSQRHHKGLVQLLGIENLQTSALVKAVKGSGRTCIDRPHLVVAKVASCSHVPHVSSPVSHVEKCKSSTRFRNGEDSEKIRRRLGEDSKLRLCARLEESLETSSRRP